MAYVGRQYLGWSFPAFTFMGDDAAGGLVPPDVAEEISPTAEKNPFAAEEQPEEQRRFSSILRTALSYVTKRDFSTARKWFHRCSDRAKIPENLREILARGDANRDSLVAFSGNAKAHARREVDEQDVMGETMYTFDQPREIIPGEGEDEEDATSDSEGAGGREAPDPAQPQSQTTVTHGRPKLQKSIYDPYCVNKIGEFMLTGMVFEKNFTAAVEHFVEAANVGNEDAQYNLGILFANILEEDPHYAILQRAVHSASEEEEEKGSSLELTTGGDTDSAASTLPRQSRKEALSILYLYAASTAGHAGALMAMGYRHSEGFDVPKICSTAALNYIEVAKGITEIYSSGMPQAVELIRLNLDHKKNKKLMTEGEINLFTQIASSGDTAVAAAIGKRYLLGIDGFRQNYGKALEYLKLAAEANHGGSFGLLGYMYALGLGVEKDLDAAHKHFVSASIEGDALGQNGLGYIYFHGTEKQERNVKLAFQHFNESSFGGSADGMFNLASVFLTGVGTDQSFQKAVLWYTQALDRGHTPAAYSLAIMHLNGVGTVRDCSIAVNLLKRVCERGSWVSSRLQEAYALQQLGQVDTTSAIVTASNQYTNADMSGSTTFLFLQLAEAGHEVAQMNLAHLLDTGKSTLLMSNGAFSRFYAQRHYELSADQGSASSELRLGDFAYYGWSRAFLSDADMLLPGEGRAEEEEEEAVLDGDMLSAEELEVMRSMGNVPGKKKTKTPRSRWSEEELLAESERRAKVAQQHVANVTPSTSSKPTANVTGEAADGISTSSSTTITATSTEINFDALAQAYSNPADMEAALSHYWKVSNMQVTGEWMQHFVARASFNLGFMYQFGLGIPQDLTLAKRLYQRSIELDPSTTTTPVTIVLQSLSVHKWLLEMPPLEEIKRRTLRDPRTHLLVLAWVLLLALLVVRPMMRRRWEARVSAKKRAEEDDKKKREEAEKKREEAKKKREEAEKKLIEEEDDRIEEQH
eukprot:g1255.t1